MDRAVPVGRRKVLGGAGALVVALGLVACTAPGSGTSGGGAGGSGGGAGAEGLPDTVRVMSIRNLTGPISFAGLNAQKGIDLAVEMIAEDGLLGGTTIEVDTRDGAGSPEEAASFASQAIADPSYVAVLGPELSSQATATSPIVEQQGMPTVYVQAGSDGVVIGDHTFRITPPAESYYDIAGDYAAEQGVTTASVLFNSGNPTLSQLGQDTVPALAEEHGFEIVGSAGVEVAAQDFTTAASQIAAQGADAAFLMVTGPQFPVAVTQLRQAGFQGELLGMSAAGAGNLSPAGQDAAGIVWPTNFTAAQADESAQQFVEAYRAKYDGETPNNYAAEAYDAMWFLARGLAQAGSADRAALQEGLAAVAAEGFAGAQGDLAFEDNDARVTGVLVRWDGSAEVPVDSGS